METRTFGRTGIEVSSLVLGTGNVGGTFIYGDDNLQRKTLRRIGELGINWLDTAPQYGNGKSETNLGRHLHELDTLPIISSKFRLEPDELDEIPGAIERSVKASLERLRVEKIDVMQLHNFIAPVADERSITVDHILKPGGVADGLAELRARDLIGHFGFTAKGDSACCVDVADSGRFDSAQVYYNMLNPSAGRDMPAAWDGQNFSGLIAACRRHNMGVMTIRILAAGILATDVRHGRESMQTENATVELEEQRARAVFEALGTEHGTRAQTAIRFCLANPDVSCVNVGIASMEQLEEAAAGAEMGPLPDEAITRLNAVYESNFGVA